MIRIWTLARKDLLETSRDRLALLFIVVMPVAFTAFFGVVFGSGSDRLPLAVNDADGGEAARQLVAALQDSAVVNVQLETAADAEKAVDEGRATAAVLIPATYSARMSSGRPVELLLVGVSGSSGVQAVHTELAAVAGRLAAGEAAARAAVEATTHDSTAQAAALPLARAIATESLADPVVAISVVEAGTAAGQIATGFAFISPGTLVNFILFSILTAGATLIQERRNFTLLRLMTTRVRRWELVGGKMAGMFLLTFVQQIILIGTGQLLFGVDYLRDPAALLLMMIGLSLVASSLGLLLAVLLSTEQALIAATVIVSMVIAALSGAWFPREIAGEAFQTAGLALPTTWILNGLRDIILRGFDAADVLPAFAISLAWSGALFVVAVSRFRLAARA